VGEHLLINCWDFPARNKVDWTTFPNSLYRKGLVIHPLASIAADGALTAEGMTDRAGLAMLQWLMVHDRWDVRFETTGDEATVVLSDGQRQQIYSAARDARTAPAATSSQRFGGPLRKGLPRAVWPIAGMIAFMAVLVAFLMRRRRATI
jgi:hypothetical protein